MLLFSSAALAATVAVLPLERGAGGERYEGLGRALAGMVTSDLAAAPGITLVERTQLDAVLAEIDLGKGAFIDPNTAAKLGKGVGAEFIVLGGYSVVGEQFLLDARLVSVATGTVVRAADAHGTVATFTAVEKDLVTALLSGLEVSLAEDARKRLLAAVPTKSFDAFAAYSVGMERQAAGKVDEARTAFGQALLTDPNFAAAKDALGGLRMSLDKQAADQKRAKDKRRTEILDKILATFTVPTNAKDKLQQAGFALRLMALQQLGLDCQRQEEMLRYLDVVGWKLSQDRAGYDRLVKDTTKLAVEVGYSPEEKADPQGHREVEFRVQTDAAPLFSSVGRYFYNFPTVLVDVPSSSDLVASMSRCLSPGEQVGELGRYAELVRAHGLSAEVPWSDKPALGERFEWSAIAVRARNAGVDAAMSARIEALIAGYSGTTYESMLMSAGQIAGYGVMVERARVAKLGFRDATLADAFDALATQDPKRLNLGNPLCATLAPRQQAFARAVQPRYYQSSVGNVAPLRDLGCFTSTEARFATPQAAVDWVATAPSRARVENATACAPAFEQLPVNVNGISYDGKPLPMDADRADRTLAWYYGNLVLPLCVTDPVTGSPGAGSPG